MSVEYEDRRYDEVKKSDDGVVAYMQRSDAAPKAKRDFMYWKRVAVACFWGQLFFSRLVALHAWPWRESAVSDFVLLAAYLRWFGRIWNLQAGKDRAWGGNGARKPSMRSTVCR